ncbi:Lrp/AsnC family transcriptional regulator [Deinococcus sp. QL22]|uniref:Lrp/AsnC family transcriptional regulator n=1 Tax=Deinococcus sp. QL22 TaxID=2939437 RepID=UPI002016FDC7|nr:Lrp/AsnC family transcriptional regulator [Deinococcus sp. QL22]UQN07988.1 Lrp/AsnC family transcriptional regulator [Deinococcus sp. QL22]
MSTLSNKPDEIEERLLNLLLENARRSLKELAEQVGMSPPSVAERLRRLEDRDIIRAFTLSLNPHALGYNVQALVRIRPLPGRQGVVEKLILSTPEFCECDKVTGDDCYVVRLFVRSIEELDVLLERIVDNAETNTSIVKSQLIVRRPPPVRAMR